MPSLSNRNQTKSPKNSSTSPTPPPPGPPPVPAPPLVPGLIAKAAAFRQLFIANGAEHHLLGGQFAVRRALRAALIEKVWAMKAHVLKLELVNLIQGQSHDIMARALLHSEVRLSDTESKDPSNPDHTRMAGVLKLNAIVNTTKIYKETTAYARELIDKPAGPGRPAVSGPDRALALEVLDDKTATGAWSWDRTQKWFKAPGLEPFSFDKLSLPRALALYMNGTVQCAAVADATAKKLLFTRGVAAKDVAAFSNATLSSVQDSEQNKPDLVLKFSATQLASVLPKVSHVLQGDSAGPLTSGYLVGGVLSGYTWDWNTRNSTPRSSTISCCSRPTAISSCSGTPPRETRTSRASKNRSGPPSASSTTTTPIRQRAGCPPPSMPRTCRTSSASAATTARFRIVIATRYKRSSNLSDTSTHAVAKRATAPADHDRTRSRETSIRGHTGAGRRVLSAVGL